MLLLFLCASANSEHTDVGVEANNNNRAQLEEVAQNADLYIVNQEANMQP